MKKFTTLFLTTILLTLFLSSSVLANEIEPNETIESTSTPIEEVSTPPIEEVSTPSIAMAINNGTLIVNDIQIETTAPILVFNRTYVDLYAVAPFLDIGLEWVEDYISYIRVSANETTIDYTLISQWDDLINLKHKFFIKDAKIFVSLRELTELVNCSIAYDKGIISIGNGDNCDTGIYNNINLYHSDDFVYITYPCPAQYVIYPYQAYSYDTMMNDAKLLQHMYPELIRTSSIGKSVENRDLLLIEFGRGPHKIFVCGTHHAREYISTTYLMYAIDRYSYAYRTGSMWGNYNPKMILDNITFCIVPMVNPDGVNLVQNGLYASTHSAEIAKMGIYEGSKYGYSAWKANVHGVDVNWNYNKDWSIEKNTNQRGSKGFNGDYAGSEPETVAVSNYVDSNSFEAFLSFHTQGQIFYWADNPEDPSGIYQAIKNDTGFIGYKEAGTGVGGSFFDYVYRKFRKPTVTVELCPFVGKFPYPDKNFDTVWRPAKNVLLVVGNQILSKKLYN